MAPGHSSPDLPVPYIFAIDDRADDRERRSTGTPLARLRPHLELFRETYRRTGSWSEATGLRRARIEGWIPDAAREPAARAGRALQRTALVVRGAPRRAGRGQPVDAPPRAAMAAGDVVVGDRKISVITADRAGVTGLQAAVERADGDLVCLLASTSRPVDDQWLTTLAQPIDDAVAATAPQLVHPRRPWTSVTPDDGRTRELGLRLAVSDGAPRLVANRAGEPVTAGRPFAVDAASAACVLIERAAILDGWPTAAHLAHLDLDDLIADLTLGLRTAGRTVLAVPDVVVLDDRPVPRAAALRTPIARGSTGWVDIVGRRGPALVRLAGRASPLADATTTITITTAAPSEKMATRWGDWHLAEAFAGALRANGLTVRVQTADHRDDLAGRAADVHLVLRGLQPVGRTRGQRHVVWIISHPDQVSDAELDDADLVLVASSSFAADLSARTKTPVEVFLQATDHHRFRPLPADPAESHPIVVVAKTRDVLRPIVADALAAGLRPTIYGSGWDRFVEPALIASSHVDNDQLPIIYSSAGVLLNDHWDAMRRLGFVSNRIFDALACGTPIISDHLPEIHDLFGSAVTTYRSVDELAAAAATLLDDPDAAREQAAVGRLIVLAEHTMERRATQLLELLARHGLSAP